MPTPLSPPQAQVPIGFVVVDGKRLPVEINAPGWYRYLAQQLFDRAGGSSAPTNNDLAEASFPSVIEYDSDDEDFPPLQGARGEQGEQGERGIASMFDAEASSEAPPMLVPGGLAMLALALTAGVTPKASADGRLEDGLLIAAGTYTPTLTNVTNLSASTAYEWAYVRIGSVMFGGGRVDVDPTAAGSTQLGFSLPVASNLGATTDCSGCAFASAIAGQGAAILGDAANNRGQIEWIAVDTTNQPMYAIFIAKVI
ncbi:MAG: hypothetical protein RLZZ182_1520 [Pseudomonadota bacterium]|jgi:hypothetical protein